MEFPRYYPLFFRTRQISQEGFTVIPKSFSQSFLWKLRLWFTADCSTAELPRNTIAGRTYITRMFQRIFGQQCHQNTTKPFMGQLPHHDKNPVILYNKHIHPLVEKQ